MPYDTQLKREPVYLRKIARPAGDRRQKADDGWEVKKMAARERLKQWRHKRRQRLNRAKHKRETRYWGPGGNKPYMSHVWFWRKHLPERKGQPCRVLLRVPQTNSVVIEFKDGFIVNTSRWAIRRRS